MALDTYANLQTAIGSTLNRSDLTATIPDFITLAEADMTARISHWRMEKRANATASAQFVGLPTDFVEMIRIGSDTQNEHRIEYVSMPEMQQMRENTADATGTPQFWTFTDGQIELFPTPNATYTLEIVYLSALDALSATNTTNWVLTRHPDAYLYGALIHSAPFLHDDARTSIWAALYQTALDGIAASDKRGRSGGTGLRMRIKGLR